MSLCGTSAAQYTMYYHKAPPSLSRENYFWLLAANADFVLHHGHRRSQITTLFLPTVRLCKEKIEV